MICVLTWADQQGTEGDGKETNTGVCGSDYHALSRGDYRKELFDEGSAKLFEKTLFEACRKCEWFLHAHVIMSDQYHFAVETPEGNVVEECGGAGYFQDPFNVWREEGGHVFQSRYKSLVIEEGRPLLGSSTTFISIQCAQV